MKDVTSFIKGTTDCIEQTGKVIGTGMGNGIERESI